MVTERDVLVLENMNDIGRMAKRYAYKNNYYMDEAVAESYYLLVCFFDKKYELYKSSENKLGYLKASIIRGLRRYFSVVNKEEQFNLRTAWKAIGKSETLLVDILEQLYPENPDIIGWIRRGFDPQDLMFWKRQFRKKIGIVLRKQKQIVKNAVKVAVVKEGMEVEADILQNIGLHKLIPSDNNANFSSCT